tara:strand:- start:17806 stop:19008 length:1203 start_codon:yes stop_codon:yes gene_type:complete
MKNWYTITKNEHTSEHKKKKYYDVFILDEIGGYGISAKNFIRDLAEIDADVLNVHVDSVGGSITDGIAMYNFLRAKDAQVDVYIEGMAGSIASIIILAGDNVYIPENASVFTHLPMLSELEYPNRNDLQEGIDHLAKFEQVLANIYMKHTGADADTVRKWMENDTFFFGQEAVDAGLATAVVDKVEMVARITDVLKTPLFASLPQEVGEKLEQIKNEVKPIMENQEQEVEETEVEETEVVATEETSETPETEAEAVEVLASADTSEAEADLSSEEEAEAEAEAETEEVEVEEVEDEEADAEDALAYEYNRKVGIKAVADKYNANGILNSVVIEALSGDTSVDEFKDVVLQTLAKAPTNKKLNTYKNEEASLDSLRQKLAETTDSAQKVKLARQIRKIRYN